LGKHKGFSKMRQGAALVHFGFFGKQKGFPKCWGTVWSVEWSREGAGRAGVPLGVWFTMDLTYRCH
jgi:hypothetical protein